LTPSERRQGAKEKMRAWDKMTPLQQLIYLELEIFRKRSLNKPVSKNDLEFAREIRMLIKAANPELDLPTTSPLDEPEVVSEPVKETAPVAPAPEPEKPKFVPKF
jgi:hypothetical protein